MLVVLGAAAQLAIVAHAPDSVNACEPIQVSVAVNSRGTEMPRLIVPSMTPFDVLDGGTRPRVQFTDRSALTVEYRYILTTDLTGRFTIPAFEARTSRDRITSRPLSVTVRQQRGRGAPVVLARARIDTGGAMNLLSAAAAETVFVGQQATYEVAVFLNDVVRERLRRNPTFYPPEMQAMLAYDLPAVSANQRRSVGSRCFDALVYRRALFPLVSGRVTIPPAQLVYSTGISSTSLFSREESHELQTDSVSIVALDPPMGGRPSEYMGAVGSIELDSYMDSTGSRVGDPMLFTVRVRGTGNVRLFPRPSVSVPWAALVPADERVRVDSGAARVSGVKEFDWVLTPRIAGEFDVPPVRYGYFNPSERRYRIAVAEGGRVRVEGGALAAADTGNLERALHIRTRYAGPAFPSPQSQPAFWLLMALAPVPAIVSGLRRRSAATRRTVATDPMRDLLGAKVSKDAVILRRQYVRALAARLGCHPEDFTHPGALARALLRAGVSAPIASRAESLLRELDSAAYAQMRSARPNAAQEATAIAKAVDAEALARSELPLWIPSLLIAVALGVATLAIASGEAGTRFARGVSEYVREDYRAARESFAAAVLLEPTSADSWANYGTASWTVDDTAGAALGWRQALAIEPSAPDIRSRMQLLRDEGPTAPAWVPALPKNAAVWLFAVLWVAAWSLAWIARRPGSWAARFPLPLAASALLVGMAAIEIETRIGGRGLAVIRHPSALSSDPALGMDRGPNVGTGEIVRVTGRRGGWTRVEATAERDGWLPSSQLILLEQRRIPRDALKPTS